MIYFFGQTASVALKNPEQGDIVSIKGHTKFRRDYSGNLHSFKSLPVVTGFKLTFKHMLKSQQIALADFLSVEAGLPFRYQDMNNQSFIVKIKNDPVDFKINSPGVSELILNEVDTNDLELELVVIS